MPNPRDWFRRRLPTDPPDSAERTVVDWARYERPTDERHEPALRIDLGSGPDEAPTRAVPPPPARGTGARGGRVIEPEAFAVRPEVTRSAHEARHEERREGTVASFA